MSQRGERDRRGEPDQLGEGRRRVVIEDLGPAVDAGRFPIKRVPGEPVRVEAAIFTDGHDRIAARLRWQREDEADWQEAPLTPQANDRWYGVFIPAEIGRYRFTVSAWIDSFQTWRHDLTRREGEGDIALALRIGAELIEAAAARAAPAAPADAEQLREIAAAVLDEGSALEVRRACALDDALATLMDRHCERRFATEAERALSVRVEPELARFSAWYEFFPRSCGPDVHRYGTLRDCEARLAYAKSMGFDIVYLPPIHPIGHTARKGPNNVLESSPDDPGSPWAIGASEGGHKSVHPWLGGIDAFRDFVRMAREMDLEVALDIAFQTSPDHPDVKAHPEWFRWRPDGTVQYAENPPKKYQDIYPFNFESDAWESLWRELKSVFDFWIAEGVRVFRVDNPHTKPFPFWEWCLGALQREHPELIFLSEAFSRPRIMYRLAKLGFSQSYTYFTWRNTKHELTEYLTELTRTELREFFRPNFWPNTPDILPEYLQLGGRPAFMVRLVLAGTLSSNYGIYGPAFELLEHEPLRPGSEEYLNSEKYQLRQWDVERPDSLSGLITRLNRVRRENPALQRTDNLQFHRIDNEQLISYSKHDATSGNALLIVANLDPYHTQSGWMELPLERFGLDPHQPYQVHDLLSGKRFLWQGRRNYVELDPHALPAHVFRVRRRVRTERDFEYFM